ncbi:amidohydrolase family protein [bacterium]|nr:amidohydrolase family protein [bacterium]
MSLSLFDVQTGVLGSMPGVTDSPGIADLKVAQRQINAVGALVRIAPDNLEADYQVLNDLLYAACENDESLIPCPVVLPNSGLELLSEKAQIDAALAAGAQAVCIRPQTDYWLVEKWVSDRLFLALEERRLPVLVSMNEVTYPQVADIAARYPNLPLILIEVGYRDLRTQIPLLQTFPNIHMSIGNRFTAHLGLEHLVKIVGPNQLVFGTGFPTAEPMSAAMPLIYADISESDKNRIAMNNFENLAGGICR